MKWIFNSFFFKFLFFFIFCAWSFWLFFRFCITLISFFFSSRPSYWRFFLTIGIIISITRSRTICIVAILKSSFPTTPSSSFWFLFVIIKITIPHIFFSRTSSSWFPWLICVLSIFISFFSSFRLLHITIWGFNEILRFKTFFNNMPLNDLFIISFMIRYFFVYNLFK